MRSKLFIILAILIFALIMSCEEDIFGTNNEDIFNTNNNAEVKVGCWAPSYNGFGNSQIGCGLVQTFGDPILDQQFNQEVAIQRSFWTGINPTVYVFDECNSKNALSFPQGFILFGRNLFFDIIYTTGSTLPNATVLAHEWAHQAQFKFGWINKNEPTVRRTELEADAFAGYYTLLKKSWAMDQFDAVFQNLYNSGDYQFNNRGHHGTPQERFNAGFLGMNTAIYALENGIQFSYMDLHQIFAPRLAKKELKKVAVSEKHRDVVDYLEKIGDRIDEKGFHSVEKLRGPNNFIAMQAE